MFGGIFVDSFQIGGDRVLERRRGRLARLHVFVEFFAGVVDESEEASLLVGIVQIEGAMAEAGFAGDVLRPGGVIAALDKQLARSAFQLRKAFRFAAGGAGVFRSLVESRLFHAVKVPCLCISSQRIRLLAAGMRG